MKTLQQLNVRFSASPIEWRGKGAIPAIGSSVTVTMNKLGPATVKGYFLGDGASLLYIGLTVELLDPPDWWKQQNPGCTTANVYGPEIAA